MRKAIILLCLVAGLTLKAQSQSTSTADADPPPVGATDLAPVFQDTVDVQTAKGRLGLILQRGFLIVGVKTDFPPFGMQDPSGWLVGMEADLAQDLADALGVDLSLERVTVSNRIERLESGHVDVVIATLGDTVARRERVQMIEPNYYASGVVAYGRFGPDIRSWEDLWGEDVCLYRDTYYAQWLVEDYGIRPQFFGSSLDIRSALLSGDCVAWALDDALLTVAEPLSWEGREADGFSVLQEARLYEVPWAIAVAKRDDTQALQDFIGQRVMRWHAEGTLIDLQDKWGIRESAFLRTMHDLWSPDSPLSEANSCRPDNPNLSDTCRGYRPPLQLDEKTAAPVGGLRLQTVSIAVFIGLFLIGGALSFYALVWRRNKGA